MRFVLLALLMFTTAVLANSPQSTGVRNGVGIPQVLDTSVSNVTSAAWVTFIASPAYACSQIQVQNTGSSPLRIGAGAAAAEVDTGSYIPASSSVTLPVLFKKGVRLSLRSLGATQSTGLVVLSCYQ